MTNTQICKAEEIEPSNLSRPTAWCPDIDVDITPKTFSREIKNLDLQEYDTPRKIYCSQCRKVELTLADGEVKAKHFRANNATQYTLQSGQIGDWREVCKESKYACAVAAKEENERRKKDKPNLKKIKFPDLGLEKDEPNPKKVKLQKVEKVGPSVPYIKTTCAKLADLVHLIKVFGPKRTRIEEYPLVSEDFDGNSYDTLFCSLNFFESGTVLKGRKFFYGEIDVECNNRIDQFTYELKFKGDQFRHYTLLIDMSNWSKKKINEFVNEMKAYASKHSLCQKKGIQSWVYVYVATEESLDDNFKLTVDNHFKLACEFYEKSVPRFQNDLIMDIIRSNQVVSKDRFCD